MFEIEMNIGNVIFTIKQRGRKIKKKSFNCTLIFEMEQESVVLSDILGPDCNKIPDDFAESLRSDVENDWLDFLENHGLKLFQDKEDTTAPQ